LSPNDFAYLSGSGCTEIEGVDDVKEFGIVVKALTNIGISTEEQNQIFSTLTGYYYYSSLVFLFFYISFSNTIKF